MPPQPPKLLDRVRTALRTQHYPAHAEEAAIAWVTRLILFHDKRHPDTFSAWEVNAFLDSLSDTAERNAARSAILFLYRQVLNRPLDLPVGAPAALASPTARAATDPLAALLDQARETLRVKHYAIRTEQAYLDWIKRFIRYHHQRHPRELGGAEACPELVEGSPPFSPTWPSKVMSRLRHRIKLSPRFFSSIVRSSARNWSIRWRRCAPASRNTSRPCSPKRRRAV
jgi:hypothetical protein